jgi:tetratricopeptide (TPR) repeat protein
MPNTSLLEEIKKMYKKSYFTILMAVAVLFAGFTVCYAQTAPMRGKVMMKQADGKEVPVADAIVDVFRTDLSGKWNTKTGKKGDFAFAGLPLGATFIVAASAPNASPNLEPNVKVGGDKEVVIILSPGDGKRWTEAEAKQALASVKTTSGGQTSESAADKKAREEMEAKNKEIMEKNTKIENANKIINQSLKDGSDAYKLAQEAVKSKNNDQAIVQFTTAVAKYDEGYNADQEYWGSAPLLLTNKATSLRSRGVIQYNLYATTKDASKLELAKKDFEDSVAAVNKALDILKAATPPTDPASAKNYENYKTGAITERAESYRLLSKVDSMKSTDAMTAYQEYLVIETDPTKKVNAQLTYADIAMQAGDFDAAIVELRKIIEQDPNNLKANEKLGYALITAGSIADDKTKTQEGTNYLQKFIDLAPETDTGKAYAKETIEQMKTQQKIVPQKLPKTTTTTTKKKP